LFSSAKGQFPESYIAEVNFYASRVDSLATYHNITLAEGTITQQVTKVIYNGTTGKNVSPRLSAYLSGQAVHLN
jgi:hypothetical protein